MEIDYARTFQQLLERYRRDDGSRWGGSAIERATGGEVPHQYVWHLLSGNIKHPSFTKIALISRVLGAPLEAWLPEEYHRTSN